MGDVLLANTHHCKNKTSAKAFASRMRKKGFSVSMSKTKKGYSVSVWR